MHGFSNKKDQLVTFAKPIKCSPLWVLSQHVSFGLETEFNVAGNSEFLMQVALEPSLRN